jgi:hypothetical protein
MDVYLNKIYIEKSCQANISIAKTNDESYFSNFPIKYEEKSKNIEKYFQENEIEKKRVNRFKKE